MDGGRGQRRLVPEQLQARDPVRGLGKVLVPREELLGLLQSALGQAELGELRCRMHTP